MHRLSWLLALAFLACGGSEGPAGPPGPQGPPGPAGTNGTNGATGANGTSADGGNATCVPNGQIACQCASGGTGFQTCAADGLSYGVCACSDAGALPDSGDGGGTFSIATMPGLLAWFKGDKGIVDDLAHAGHVKRWLDQSGNGNDAQQRAGTDFGPTHDPAALNGIDAVYFDFQTGLEIADSQSFKIGTDDFAVVFVAKIQPGSTYATTFLTNNSLTISIGQSPGALEVNAAGVTASIGWPSGAATWRTFAVRGKTLKLAIGDAVATTSSSSTADLTPGAGWTILPQTTGTLATAEMAELLIVKGAVSDADLAKVQAILKTKYNL